MRSGEGEGAKVCSPEPSPSMGATFSCLLPWAARQRFTPERLGHLALGASSELAHRPTSQPLAGSCRWNVCSGLQAEGIGAGRPGNARESPSDMDTEEGASSRALCWTGSPSQDGAGGTRKQISGPSGLS